MSKGSRRERELRDELSDREFVVVRTAGSGSAPGFDLPDLLVGDGTRIWAIEVKSWDPEANRTYYLEPEEVDSLQRFSRRFSPNTEARVGIRVDYDTTWYIPLLSSLPPRTEGGRVPLRSHNTDDMPTLDDALRGPLG